MSKPLTRSLVIAFGALASTMVLVWGAPAVMAAPFPIPVLIWQYQQIHHLIAN